MPASVNAMGFGRRRTIRVGRAAGTPLVQWRLFPYLPPIFCHLSSAAIVAVYGSIIPRIDAALLEGVSGP
jgi:hypothetical protein